MISIIADLLFGINPGRDERIKNEQLLIELEHRKEIAKRCEPFLESLTQNQLYMLYQLAQLHSDYVTEGNVFWVGDVLLGKVKFLVEYEEDFE